MPRPIDPKIAEVLKSYGFDRDAVWDCHGTWVVYHKVCEQIAANAAEAAEAVIQRAGANAQRCVLVRQVLAVEIGDHAGGRMPAKLLLTNLTSSKT